MNRTLQRRQATAKRDAGLRKTEVDRQPIRAPGYVCDRLPVGPPPPTRVVWKDGPYKMSIEQWNALMEWRPDRGSR